MKDKNSSSPPRTAEYPLEVKEYINDYLEERKTSILTDSLRKYLLGQDEFEGKTPDQQENQKRMRLRNRVEDGISDFILLNYMGDTDKRLIFRDVSEDEKLYQGIKEMIAFIYSGLKDTPIEFEKLVQDSIHSAEAKSPTEAGKKIDKVWIEIEKTYQDEVDMNEIRNKLEKRRPITQEEFIKVVEHLYPDRNIEQADGTSDRIYLDDAFLYALDQEESDDLPDNSR